MTLHPLTAEELLVALEAHALAAEEAEPFSTRDKRTVSRVIDATLAGAYPRCRLDVTAAYHKFIERMCLYGNVAAARTTAAKHGSGLHLEYVCWLEGERYVLTEAQAVELIETGELPVPRKHRFNDGSDPFRGLS